ncbi:MAG: ABC transporter ATP-binding protein, partial [Acidimicrobiia bacterium]|nr:ABC transporter ATP-binding protein [Acidimicrobiia bacterium]
FALGRGSRTGLIGESGSGKSLTALAVLGLLPDNLEVSGTVTLDGQELSALDDRALCAVRGNDVSMVFQEPMTALNPVMRVGNQVAEALVRHRGASRAEALHTAISLLEQVGVEEPERRTRSFPHEMSGGQRQRVMIAMAVACGPDLVIADEPTTALDVTVQAKVLEMLSEQVRAASTALLLITHDLPLVSGATDEVLVLKDGRLVESGSTSSVFDAPQDPHTRTLVDAVPPLSRTDISVGSRPSPIARPPMVRLESVRRDFDLPRSRPFGPRGSLTAVDDVSLEVGEGETYGLVGESGSGKTTLARMLVDLDTPTSGRITWEGLEDVDRKAAVQMVFQDPMGSLDPRMRILDVIAEPLRALGIAGAHRARVEELLDAVHLPRDAVTKYPHEFSGGERQRIAIARALAPHPKVLVADEPVSALDMSVRERTLELLRELREGFGLTMLFISHDLSVVHEVCDRVGVLRDGRLVEEGPADAVLRAPSEPYTQALVEAIPRLA